MRIHKTGVLVLTAYLLFGTASSFAQEGARQDIRNAGTETKNAAKDTSHGVKTGTKKAYHKTENGTEKAYNKTAKGTKRTYHKTANGTKNTVDRVEGKPTNPPQ